MTIILLAAVLLGGCGTDHGIGDGAYDPRDGRVTCLTGKGLPAHKVGESYVFVDRPGRPPLRIFFANTPGEAESLAVAAKAQGAEQLGRALLYVGDASEATLTKLEDCLDDQ